MAEPNLPDPHFVDRAPALGLTHAYTGGWEHFVGGGIAAFDCDGDDLPELYAAGGEAPAILLRNRSKAAGDLTYEAATPEALTLTRVTGAYPLDIDSDGLTDLAILRAGPNILMRGGPDCSFALFPSAMQPDTGNTWTTAFSATWERDASLPTLAFGNYVDRSNPNGPFEACDVNHLVRPGPGGYRAPLELDPGFCALSILFTDWGRRGRADLRVSNDRHYYVRGGGEQMWAMESEPRLYTRAEGWRPFALWGMGIASRDITGDGMPEVYLTSMGDQRLQLLDPDAAGPAYRDAPYQTGTTAHRPFVGDEGRPSTGWHAAFGDVDNDGRDDLFVAKGNVEQMPSNAIEDPNNLLMQRPDGTFAEVADRAGVASVARARGAVLTDLNRDGLLDIAVVNRNAPIEILQNVSDPVGNWLMIDVHQPAPNPDAVGAWIEVETPQGRQSREITVGGGHVSGWTGPHHFGLGDADTARIRVIWPGGQAGAWQTVEANRIHRIDRP